MSRREVVAKIAIAVFAMVMVGEAAATIHIDQNSHGKVSALPTQLIEVKLSTPWTDLASSDDTVIKLIYITLKPTMTGYFVAAAHGKATLHARTVCTSAPGQGCFLYLLAWSVEVDVR